jgi:hypothetical protein
VSYFTSSAIFLPRAGLQFGDDRSTRRLRASLTRTTVSTIAKPAYASRAVPTSARQS